MVLRLEKPLKRAAVAVLGSTICFSLSQLSLVFLAALLLQILMEKVQMMI